MASGHTLPQTCLTSTSTVGASGLTALAPGSVAAQRPQGEEYTPIDRAFAGLRVVAQLAEVSRSDWNPHHGQILSASAVAVAEDYFRTILTEVAAICPLCKRAVGSLETKLSFVEDGSFADALRDVLDRTSFSSRVAIKDWSGRIAGFNPNSSQSLAGALSEYERVCHIRHCALHAGGYIASHNAEVLGVEPGTWITFSSPKSIYEIVAVVTATIRAFNQCLIEHLLTQWINEAILVGEWGHDGQWFRPLWNTFRSTGDIESGRFQGRSDLRVRPYDAYRLMQPAVRARYQAMAGA